MGLIMKKNVFILVSILTVSASFGEIYKCKVKGNIAYQATPCLQAKGSTKVKVNISKLDKRPKLIKDCERKCESNENICRSGLSGGNYNSDGGLKYCISVLKACTTRCTDPQEAKRLTEIANKVEKQYKSKIENKKTALRANKIRKENIAKEKLERQKEMEFQAKIHKEKISQQAKIQEENKKLQEENIGLQHQILREQRQNNNK